MPGAKCPLELRDKLAGATWPAVEARPGGGELIVLGGEEVGGTSPDVSGWAEAPEDEPWSWNRERSFLSSARMSSMPGDFPCVSPSLSPHWLGATAGRGVGVEVWAGAGSCSPTEVGTVMLLSGSW